MKILLLPGLDGTGLLFEDFIKKLPAHLEPIVCSYPNDPDLGYDDLFAVAQSFCPENEPYIVLGESFSGPIAIDIAVNAAHRPCLLILVNTFISSPRKLLTKLVRYAPGTLLSNPPIQVLKYLLKDAESNLRPFDGIKHVIESLSPELVKSRLMSIHTLSAERMAARVEVPVCVLQAVKDSAVTKSAFKELVQTLKYNTTYAIPGNHFSLQTFPETAAGLIGEFVRDNKTLR